MQYNVRFPWHYGCHKSEGEKENRVRQPLDNCFSIKPKRLAKLLGLFKGESTEERIRVVPETRHG